MVGVGHKGESEVGGCARHVVATLLVLALTTTSAGAQVTGIAGDVRYYSNQSAVPDVALLLVGPVPGGAVTDATGAYEIADPGVGNWQLTPLKSGDTRGAISALDASHILQAVVGMRDFNPLQQIACDVTGDGSVSSLDAARILQLIAGLRSRLPVADVCGSDWAFMPDAAAVPNQRLLEPGMIPACNLGGIAYEPLLPPADAQSFLAIAFGDCTGNWQGPTPPPTATATPTEGPPPTETATPPDTATPTAAATATATPLATSTVTATATGTSTNTAPPATATATPIPSTPTLTSTPPPTITPTRTGTATGTVTSTATGTATGTATRTGTATLTQTRTPTETRTLTPTVTQTFTRTVTQTWTPSNTPAPTSTSTATRTRTSTPTGTVTWTATGTRTGTRTQTPTPTASYSPTPTVTCVNGLSWQMSAPRLISAQSPGGVWLTKTVPTDTGWGIFWQREASLGGRVELFYAHVDFNGQITHGPLQVTTINRLTFRGRYYLAAWHEDHYGILISEGTVLSYWSMSMDGELSGRKVVGVQLFANPAYDQEADGDLDAYPGGFVGVIEGECDGHSCAYAFKLDPNGNAVGLPTNLVDFDFTHQFYPRSAFDGSGFAIISVKDIDIANGGVLTKYLPATGSIGTHAKVVPSKQYLWDEFPDIAWNGDHFAAVWTENSARSHQQPWQIHFASFRRTKTTSNMIGERIIDVVAQKTNHRWTTQVHPSGADWIAQYASRAADNSIVAVYELLGDNAQSRAVLEPFTMTADALGSSPHTAPGHAGTLGIARGSNLPGGGSEVAFYTLPPPTCH